MKVNISYRSNQYGGEINPRRFEAEPDHDDSEKLKVSIQGDYRSSDDLFEVSLNMKPEEAMTLAHFLLAAANRTSYKVSVRLNP